MPTLVRQAKTSEDLDEILRLRFEAMKAAGDAIPPQVELTGKYLDHVDIFPDTLNLFALTKGKVSAAIRASRFQPETAPSSGLFDFREAHAGIRRPCAILNHLVIAASAVRPAELAVALVKFALLNLSQTGLAAAFFCAPRPIVSTLKGLGFQAVAEDFSVESLAGETLTPMVIDLAEFERLTFSKVLDREILRFRELFSLTLFEPGEILAVQGEKGQTAYLIEHGNVEVLLQRPDSIIPLTELTAGHLIGEIAMITREPRTASLVAKTQVTCFSIDRADFLRLLKKEPYRSLDLFKICSKRLETANRRLAKSQGAQ